MLLIWHASLARLTVVSSQAANREHAEAAVALKVDEQVVEQTRGQNAVANVHVYHALDESTHATMLN